jgi:hypothetical protein
MKRSIFALCLTVILASELSAQTPLVSVGVGVNSCGEWVAAIPVFAESRGGATRGPVSSFDELWTKVKSGDTVYVLDSSARETTGTFAKASQASMELLVDGQIREIPLTDIRQVARRGDSLWNGALIGAAFGAVTLQASCGSALNGSGECTRLGRVGLAMMGAGVWGAIGAGIDALIHGRTVVYRSTAQRTARFIPTLSWRQVSARLSVGF